MRGVPGIRLLQPGYSLATGRVAGFALSALIAVLLAASPGFAQDRDVAKAVNKVKGSVTAWKNEKAQCSQILQTGNLVVENIHDSSKPEDQATVKAERNKGLRCVNAVLKKGDGIAEDLDATKKEAEKADKAGDLSDDTRSAIVNVWDSFYEEFNKKIFDNDLDGYLIIGSLATGSIDGAYLPRNWDDGDKMNDLPLWRD